MRKKFWPLIYDRAFGWLKGWHSGRLKHICLCSFFVWPTHCIRCSLLPSKRNSGHKSVGQLPGFRWFQFEFGPSIRATGLWFTHPQSSGPNPHPQSPFPSRYAAQRAGQLANWTASSFDIDVGIGNGRKAKSDYRHTTTKDSRVPELQPGKHFSGGLSSRRTGSTLKPLSSAHS